MNEEIKGRWLDALLSGEYPKTEEFLRNDEGYCAYGVLCEMAAEDGAVERWRSPGQLAWRYGADGSTNFPPTEVLEWAGLTWAGIEDPSEKKNLFSINDRPESTFDDAARFIKDFG